VVSDRNERPEEVLACIAKGLGFTHISLSRDRDVVEAGVNLSKGTIQAAIKVLKNALFVIKRSFPSIAAKIGAIIELLDKLERLIDRLLDNPPQERVEDVLPPGKCVCKDQPKTKEA